MKACGQRQIEKNGKLNGIFYQKTSLSFSITNEVNLQEKHRVYVRPELTAPRTVFLEKHFVGPDTTSGNRNLIPAPHPLCVPRFARSQVMEYAQRVEQERPPKSLGTCPNSRASTPCKGPPWDLHSCPHKTRITHNSPWCPLQPSSLPCSPRRATGIVDFTKAMSHLSVPLSSELLSVPSVRRPGIKSLSYPKGCILLIQISQRILRKA